MLIFYFVFDYIVSEEFSLVQKEMSNFLRICIVKIFEWVNCFEFLFGYYVCVCFYVIMQRVNLMEMKEGFG